MSTFFFLQLFTNKKGTPAFSVRRRPLPRNDPSAMAQMIRQCTPKAVFGGCKMAGDLDGKTCFLSRTIKDGKVFLKNLW